MFSWPSFFSYYLAWEFICLLVKFLAKDIEHPGTSKNASSLWKKCCRLIIIIVQDKSKSKAAVIGKKPQLQKDSIITTSSFSKHIPKGRSSREARDTERERAFIPLKQKEKNHRKKFLLKLSITEKRKQRTVPPLPMKAV